jgi:hypothetical protein
MSENRHILNRYVELYNAGELDEQGDLFDDDLETGGVA